MQRRTFILSGAAVLISATVPAAHAAGGFHQMLNAARRQNGLTAMGFDQKLAQAAAIHASDMARLGRLTHTGSNGQAPKHRIKAQGYCRASTGENIAEGFRSEESVFRAWMNSPKHYQNMMASKFINYGLGESQGYWVMTLGGKCV